MRRIFVRALLAWHAARAERAGVARGHSGAVVVAQRFGSALNLNLHFHALVLDGVYASADPCTRPVFHPAEAPSDGNVAELVALLHRRVLRYLARSGRLRRAAEVDAEPEPEEPLLAELYSASVRKACGGPGPPRELTGWVPTRSSAPFLDFSRPRRLDAADPALTRSRRGAG